MENLEVSVETVANYLRLPWSMCSPLNLSIPWTLLITFFFFFCLVLEFYLKDLKDTTCQFLYSCVWIWSDGNIVFMIYFSLDIYFLFFHVFLLGWILWRGVNDWLSWYLRIARVLNGDSFINLSMVVGF